MTSQVVGTRRTPWASIAQSTAATALLALALASPASALDEQAGDQKAIKSCEERLCTMLLRKEAKGDDLKCTLGKTWGRNTIKSADTASAKWGFGDARCTVDLNISRALIVGAVASEGKFKLHVPPHTANCQVEQDGQVKTFTATLAPKIVFKDGKAEKVWVNLMKVEGPTAIRDTIRLVAQLEDGLGLFHRPMLKAINRFIHTSCARNYPQAIQSASSQSTPARKPKAAKPAAPPAAKPEAPPAPAAK